MKLPAIGDIVIYYAYGKSIEKRIFDLPAIVISIHQFDIGLIALRVFTGNNEDFSTTALPGMEDGHWSLRKKTRIGTKKKSKNV